MYEDLKTGNPTVSNESDGFELNNLYFAFQVAGNGGRIAVWKISAPGRLPSKLPCIVNGSDINDFKFNPFDPNVLLTACDDGKLRRFKINHSSLDDIHTPEASVSAHSNRVSFLLFHPTIIDLALSASPERGESVVKLWNISTMSCTQTIQQTDVTLCACFNREATLFATIGRDAIMSVFDLKTGNLVKKAASHKGGKSARMFWLEGLDAIASVGFGRFFLIDYIVHPSGKLWCIVKTLKIPMQHY